MATGAAQVLYTSCKASPCTAMHWMFTVVSRGEAVDVVCDLQHDIFLWLQPAYGAQQQASYRYTQQGTQGAVAQAAQGLAPDQQARVSQIVAQVSIYIKEHSASTVSRCRHQ